SNSTVCTRMLPLTMLSTWTGSVSAAPRRCRRRRWPRCPARACARCSTPPASCSTRTWAGRRWRTPPYGRSRPPRAPPTASWTCPPGGVGGAAGRGSPRWPPPCPPPEAALAALPVPGLRPVLNATGVLLHTNLGRAPLADAAVRALTAAAGTTDVELDLSTGRRGRRGRAALAALAAAVPAAGAVHVV